MTTAREQYARVMADACLNHREVMNEAVVTWHPQDGFQWGSSLTPVGDGEIIVERDVRQEYYDPDETGNREDLIAYFLDMASDDGWQEVAAVIEEAREENG